ncbi:response regulator [Sphingobium sp. PNB]|uniref:response regulator n=1 Tax=Sphingobium sp. PNB TaxID=863934 RepID=UPI001CA3D922|nr:response regulator [Sphingobium sp. PNB]MCB4860407.1 response regulator [Sphingobium sp. PNB]
MKAYAERTHLLADPLTKEGNCLIAEHRPGRMDGSDLLYRLRVAGWQNPAILTTVDGSLETKFCTRGAGYVHILRKPFPHHVLLDLVDRTLAAGAG